MNFIVNSFLQMQNEMSETFKLYRNAFFHPKGYTKIDTDSIMISYSNDVFEISLNFTIFSVLILSIFSSRVVSCLVH